MLKPESCNRCERVVPSADLTTRRVAEHSYESLCRPCLLATHEAAQEARRNRRNTRILLTVGCILLFLVMNHWPIGMVLR